MNFAPIRLLKGGISMNENNYSKEIFDIKSRISYLRETLEMSQEEIAKKLNITVEQYAEYETGEADIPIGVIYSLATSNSALNTAPPAAPLIVLCESPTNFQSNTESSLKRPNDTPNPFS